MSEIKSCAREASWELTWFASCLAAGNCESRDSVPWRKAKPERKSFSVSCKSIRYSTTSQRPRSRIYKKRWQVSLPRSKWHRRKQLEYLGSALLKNPLIHLQFCAASESNHSANPNMQHIFKRWWHPYHASQCVTRSTDTVCEKFAAKCED